MNTSTYILAGLTACLGSVETDNSKSKQTDLLLQDAISKGVIQVASNSSGGFSGKCVSMNIQNKTYSTLEIKIPRGTLFYPNDSGEQTLITVNEQFISLSPNEIRSERINAYCSEHSDRSPSNGTHFTLGRNINPKFDSLFAFMNNRSIPSSEQAIVWAISDNSPISSISNDTKTMRDLRKYLSVLTGQEEVDYSFDIITSVDSQGYIHETPYQLKGFVNFDVDQRKWIHQEVYNENGKLKFKSQQAFEIPKGESDYTFNIIVKNWESGKYSLKLKHGSEVVKTYNFKV